MRFGFGLLFTGPHPPLPRFCSTKKSLSQALRASPKSPSSPTQVLFYKKKRPFPGSDSGLSLFFWGQELPFQGARACFFFGPRIIFSRGVACFFWAKNYPLKGPGLVFLGPRITFSGGGGRACFLGPRITFSGRDSKSS